MSMSKFGDSCLQRQHFYALLLSTVIWLRWQASQVLGDVGSDAPGRTQGFSNESVILGTDHQRGSATTASMHLTVRYFHG